MCVCVSFQASPRLSVLATAPTKQTETASACLHAWNSARPNHARLLRCTDAREYNYRLQITFSFGHMQDKTLLLMMWKTAAHPDCIQTM